MKHFFFFLLFLFALASCNNNNTNTALKAMTDEKAMLVTQEAPDTFGTDTVSTAYLMGKYEPSTRSEFAKIEAKYTDKEAIYLRKEAYTAFKKMFVAAEKDGVKLKILSATRNFAYQKRIWENKWETAPINKIKEASKRATAILEYSAMPGSSRHHWGTDMDLNSLNGGDFESGVGLKIYTWLSENASSYGFCQPYTKKGKLRQTGYNEEKWHWSYLPMAQKLTEVARKKLKNEMITGFLGAETAIKLDVVNNYVLSINPECK